MNVDNIHIVCKCTYASGFIILPLYHLPAEWLAKRRFLAVWVSKLTVNYLIDTNKASAYASSNNLCMVSQQLFAVVDVGNSKTDRLT